jgi:hypothetical protein
MIIFYFHIYVPSCALVYDIEDSAAKLKDEERTTLEFMKHFTFAGFFVDTFHICRLMMFWSQSWREDLNL